MRINRAKFIYGILLIIGICLLINYWIEHYKKVTLNEFEISKQYFTVNGEKILLKGVNIGAGKPYFFPGEHGIKKQEYFNWFKLIKDMNANAIRIYTVHPPEFYEALLEFNMSQEEPIYLIHGVWFEESYMEEFDSVNSQTIKNGFSDEIKKVVRLVHGDITIPEVTGHAFGKYKADVSNYTIGYLIGIEFYGEFVYESDKFTVSNYEGKYFYSSENASSFEIFLSEMMDTLAVYEKDNYNRQTPLSFVNWVTTDPLVHPNEPYIGEDLGVVDPNHVKVNPEFKAGMFASYHVYPYYPDGIIYSNKYKVKNDEGIIDTYTAYLKELIEHHDMPVIIAEYGIPASRGKAHENNYLGFNQGNMTEDEQGKAISYMTERIYETGYAGAFVFSWQDEWFKRTWNTVHTNIADRRAYWNDVQTNEQNFGLIRYEEFEPWERIYLDGEVDDWLDKDILFKNKDYEIGIKSDSAYVYLMLKSIETIDNQNITVGIDTIKNQGNFKYSGINFNNAVDFVLNVKKEKAVVKVDSYYDVFYYELAKTKKLLESNSLYEDINNEVFNDIRLCLHYGMWLPETSEKIPLDSYVTGNLKKGISDYNSEKFDSLSDYYVKDNVLEVRIPWGMLNFMDPSTKQIMGNFYDKDKQGIYPVEIDNINLFFYSNNLMISDLIFDLEGWGVKPYNMVIKKSYYYLQNTFSNH